ncbi:MAG: chitobiase/beta-hexosaminidase C-terminal domain-containing protein, partial [Firmicutes bacterium]|nr:chitobiase/beta-hexosaminidase C-terminal domain-containing protein [Bacillota bacterium]
MTAGASTSIDGSSPVVYASEDNDTYKWFKAPFEPVYTVTAGEAENGSVTVKPIEAKEGDAVTVTAFFKKLLFTVVFADEDGTELQRGTVPYGEQPVFEGADPVKDADDEYTYTFKGWEPELSEAAEDVTYKAVYTAEPVEEPGPQQVEAPVLPKDGSFSGSKTITITCGTEGAVIYYTTDGSDPALTTAAALEYSGGFRIDKTTTVAAIAVKDGWLDSEVVRGVYTLKEKPSGGGGGSSAPAKAEEPFVNPFKDVKQGDWFYDAVMWAVKNGVTDGVTPTTFSPSGSATRAQTVTF